MSCFLPWRASVQPCSIANLVNSLHFIFIHYFKELHKYNTILWYIKILSSISPYQTACISLARARALRLAILQSLCVSASRSYPSRSWLCWTILGSNALHRTCLQEHKQWRHPCTPVLRSFQWQKETPCRYVSRACTRARAEAWHIGISSLNRDMYYPGFKPSAKRIWR